MTLAKNGYFLRAFELKSKFPHVPLKNPPPPPHKKKKNVRQLSSCTNKK